MTSHAILGATDDDDHPDRRRPRGQMNNPGESILANIERDRNFVG
jgi:hypothetical protein